MAQRKIQRNLGIENQNKDRGWRQYIVRSEVALKAARELRNQSSTWRIVNE
jgi:hypothetical protein